MKLILDSTDTAILNILQTDASLSYKQIASLLHKSQATITNRIRRLKERNVILNTTVVINEKLLGYTYTAMLSIKFNDLSDEAFDIFVAELSKIDARCIYAKRDGDFDVQVEITTRDSQTYARIKTEIGKIEHVTLWSDYCITYSQYPQMILTLR